MEIHAIDGPAYPYQPTCHDLGFALGQFQNPALVFWPRWTRTNISTETGRLKFQPPNELLLLCFAL